MTLNDGCLSGLVAPVRLSESKVALQGRRVTVRLEKAGWMSWGKRVRLPHPTPPASDPAVPCCQRSDVPGDLWSSGHAPAPWAYRHAKSDCAGRASEHYLLRLSFVLEYRAIAMGRTVVRL